jgi:hypothetical protein
VVRWLAITRCDYLIKIRGFQRIVDSWHIDPVTNQNIVFLFISVKTEIRSFISVT